MSRQLVGVDIDDAAVRAVRAKTSASGKVKVLAFHELALPHGAVMSGRIQDRAAVVSVLKRMWREEKLRVREVVLGLGDQNVVAREVTVPRMRKQDLALVLPGRVQELIPMPVADAVLDFYPSAEGPVTEEGPTMQGLLIAAHLDAVSTHVAAARDAGLTVLGVDFLPFAVHRAVAPSSAQTTAVIDLGRSSTSVTISSGGIPDFVRIIAVGTTELTRAAGGQAAAGFAERDPARELVSSITNTIRYYTGAREGRTVDSVIVTGPGSRMGSLVDDIAASAGLMPHRPNDFPSVAVAHRLGSLIPDFTARAGAAVGLAMGGRA